MKIPTLYLDTSVIGGYFDDEWKDATRELWQQMRAGKFRFVTSSVTLDEVNAAPENVRGLFASTFPLEHILDPGRRARLLPPLTWSIACFRRDSRMTHATSRSAPLPKSSFW